MTTSEAGGLWVKFDDRLMLVFVRFLLKVKRVVVTADKLIILRAMYHLGLTILQQEGTIQILIGTSFPLWRKKMSCIVLLL
jgi:hypothetical protein